MYPKKLPTDVEKVLLLLLSAKGTPVSFRNFPEGRDKYYTASIIKKWLKLEGSPYTVRNVHNTGYILIEKE